MALLGALVIASVALSATKTVCPNGNSASPYCTTVTITGTDPQAVAAAEQTGLAIVNGFSPTAITQTLTHGSFTIVLTKIADGTYTVTVTNSQGLVIGSGTTVVIHKTSDVASAAAVHKLKVTLTPAGKQYIKTHRGVKLTVTSTFKPKHGKKKAAKLTVKI
ncbi:MAG: hypothetical protein ACYDHH_12085 [Solirubrobacteraceae bacterium]